VNVFKTMTTFRIIKLAKELSPILMNEIPSVFLQNIQAGVNSVSPYNQVI